VNSPLAQSIRHVGHENRSNVNSGLHSIKVRLWLHDHNLDIVRPKSAQCSISITMPLPYPNPAFTAPLWSAQSVDPSSQHSTHQHPSPRPPPPPPTPARSEDTKHPPLTADAQLTLEASDALADLRRHSRFRSSGHENSLQSNNESTTPRPNPNRAVLRPQSRKGVTHQFGVLQQHRIDRVLESERELARIGGWYDTLVPFTRLRDHEDEDDDDTDLDDPDHPFPEVLSLARPLSHSSTSSENFL